MTWCKDAAVHVAQVTAAAQAYEELRLHDALEAVVAIANRGNLYMEQVAPWTAFKKVSTWGFIHAQPMPLQLLLHALCCLFNFVFKTA